MSKRKTAADNEDSQGKRSRLSDEASDTNLNDNNESIQVEETTVNQSSTSSPYRKFLGKFVPNLSLGSKTDDSITERGDNNVGQATPGSNRNSLSPRKASSIITNCKGTTVLIGKIKLKNKWSNDLLDTSTQDYKTLSLDYIKGDLKKLHSTFCSDDLSDQPIKMQPSDSGNIVIMIKPEDSVEVNRTESRMGFFQILHVIDELMHNSNVSKVYMNSVICKFSSIPNSNTRATRKSSPGNVMVHSEMTFHHTYTKLFTDLEELCHNVEDFITLQASLGEMDEQFLQIDDSSDAVSIEIKKQEDTENEDDEVSTVNGHSGEELNAAVEDDFVDAHETHQKEADGNRVEDDNSVNDLEKETSSMEVVADINETPAMESNEPVQPKVGQESAGDAAGHGEIITTNNQEGEQIVVGKQRISDVADENLVQGGEKHVSKEERDSKKKSKGKGTKKEVPPVVNQPSGSGIKKSPNLRERIEITKKEESDHDDDAVPSEPGAPVALTKTSNSITLKWSRPKKGSKSVDHYEIKYKKSGKGKGKWISVLSEGAERTVKMKDLRAETEYEFKVRAVNEDGEEGPFCQESVKFSTVSSLARSLIPMANMIDKGNPKVYKLPLVKHVDTINEKAKTRKCIFGSASEGVTAREKTIMVIGATGSGKTTLVDGMINYITDVSWEDGFRFSLVDLTEDEKKRKANEAESQTEWITCYTINKMEGSTIDYTLNIIDTPGFGDTRGIVRDKRIVDQIREFFTTPGRQGITCLDAVCFVTQAPMGKLTPPQRYIFDQILSVFGQDIKSNIFVLITFADANEPPVRAALKAANVPYQKSFKFNNSALYASPENPAESEMGNLFWKMGKESFKIFFDELKTAESKSLLLTSEVLQLRKRIEATIQGLQQQIADGMNKLNTIKQEREILKRHKADIKAKKDFTYEVDEVHMYQVDLEPGVYVTNCMACNRTCHFPCGIPDDRNKQNCAAIDKQQCTVCPMNCHWTIHKNNSFRFDTYTMKVTKTYEELKKKYEIAQKEAQKHKCVLGKIKSAFTSHGQDVMKMVHEVRCCINKLNDIALRPNPLSDKDYIDLLIESEKHEKKYGWEQRIKLFYKLREEAELVEKMNQQNYQPWVLDDSDESDDDGLDDESSQGDASSAAEDDFPLNVKTGDDFPLNVKTEEPDMEVG